MSVKLEQFIIVLCRWSSFFTQVELFLLNKKQIFSQLALNSSGKILLVRLTPFFYSQWQTQVLVISVFCRNSFRSSGFECSCGEGGGKRILHIFYSSVSVQLISVCLHQLFTSHLQLATIFLYAICVLKFLVCYGDG